MKQWPVTTLKTLESFADIVFRWNEKINLTSYTKAEFFSTGVYDCTVLLEVLNLLEIKELADIGTGYGMPGMVLKILNPALSIHLVDASEKKIAFLQYISKILNVRVEIHQKKLPDPSWKRRFSCIVSKASMKENRLIKTANDMLSFNGRLIYFGGQTSPEPSKRLPLEGAVFYKREDNTYSKILIRKAICT